MLSDDRYCGLFFHLKAFIGYEASWVEKGQYSVKGVCSDLYYSL